MGMQIDKLTKEQEKYLASWEMGTCWRDGLARPAQTLRLDRTKCRIWLACGTRWLRRVARTQLRTVLALRFADRICSLSRGALAPAIRDMG